jgi:hypothetical protein
MILDFGLRQAHYRASTAYCPLCTVYSAANHQSSIINHKSKGGGKRSNRLPPLLAFHS